jgi:hypothetical protein
MCIRDRGKVMKKTITFLAVLTAIISTIIISAEVFGGKWNSSPQY